MAYRLGALDVLPEIELLAKETLTEQELAETDLISERLQGKKDERRWGIAACIVKVGIEPSRPLFYWAQRMEGLPRSTRDCVRYLGDYIDLLAKEMAFELLGNGRKRSLTANSKALLKVPSVEVLADILLRYSNFLYTPGKHDFSLLPGRDHRFTTKEVVLCAYVTSKLAKEVLRRSRGARTAVEKDNLYAIGGSRWGSSKRVEYWGDPMDRAMEPPSDP